MAVHNKEVTLTLPASLQSQGAPASVTVPLQLFIDNKFHDATTGKVFSVVNPSTEGVITDAVAEGNDKDVDLAVQAAKRAASGPWYTMSGTERGKLLHRLSELYEKYRHQFAFIESLNVGKPYFESFNFDLKQTIECFRYFAGWADKNHGKTIPISGDNICYTVNEPLGVVGLILPWNFPQQLLAWKLAPCLATGNTVVIKPAEQTPLSTLLLARLVVDAGFPPGVINIVTGFGPVVGSALALHMQVDKVGFTGSTRVGRLVQEYSAKSNLKAVSLELGGKSPIIVFDDAPSLEACITDCYHALFWNAGQCCSAGSRIFVQDTIYDKFVAEAVKMAKARKVGDPFDAATAQGPQVSSLQFDSVMRYIEAGKREGAKLMCGGSRHGNKGFFIEPTVFSDVTDSMTIAKEEIFGPVMSIIKFSSIEEVVKRANDTVYGLVSAVYTRDVSRALTVAKKLKTGIVWVNTYNVIEPAIPWGGFKQSGHGRDMSEYALAQYTSPKTVIINHKL